jgi:hypothetical protein
VYKTNAAMLANDIGVSSSPSEHALSSILISNE